MRIHSILNRKGGFVATIHPDATAIDASRSLIEHHIGALVVSEDGTRIDGIVSERDLARSIATHGDAALHLKVRDLMTLDVRTCHPNDPIDQLMGVMTEHRVRHLPVLDDGGALVGIISIGDVVKHRVGELEEEAHALHEYINGGR